MNVLTIIPARGKSSRVANKNIRILSGKPLIAYTIEKALESKLSSKVVVSTEDSKIAKIAEDYGVGVIERPKHLALDTSAIDDALRHAVRYLEEKENFRADIVVLLHANVPVRKKGEIDEVINKLIENQDATAVATGFIVDQRPEWMKVVDPKTGKVKPFLEPTELYRKQDLVDLYLFDGAVTAVKTKTLMQTEGIKKVHAYLGNNVYIFIHEGVYSIEIDEEKDFELAEYFLNKELKKLEQ